MTKLGDVLPNFKQMELNPVTLVFPKDRENIFLRDYQERFQYFHFLTSA